MATLKVTVHEARDLPIMDRTTGLADPYVLVRLDDTEHTTDIVHMSRHPVWNTDLRIDTSDLFVLQEDPLEVRLYDHDIISRDDLVGLTFIDCNSMVLQSRPSMSGWFPLFDTTEEGIRGEIRLTLKIKFHNAENPLAPRIPIRYAPHVIPLDVEHANRAEDQLLSSNLTPEMHLLDGFEPLRPPQMQHPSITADEEGILIFSAWRLDPSVYRVESVLTMVEELIVKADPEHSKLTNLRSTRTTNEARIVQLYKLSGKVRRQLTRKVVEAQCNAVLGYVEEFDMDANGIVVRGYGTPCVVSAVKFVDREKTESCLPTTTRVAVNPTETPSGYLTPAHGSFNMMSPMPVIDSVGGVAASAIVDAQGTGAAAGTLLVPAMQRSSVPGPVLLPLSLAETQNVTQMAFHSSTQPPPPFSSAAQPQFISMPHDGHSAVILKADYGAPGLPPQQSVTGTRTNVLMLTLKDLPYGMIEHIGGYISARSVKIVGKFKSKVRLSLQLDRWWIELRNELKANARAFNCNVILGYEEVVMYHGDVAVLSLSGTAVVLNSTMYPLRCGPEYIYQTARERFSTQKNCSALHLLHPSVRLTDLVGETGAVARCNICHRKSVPEVLLMTCAMPQDLTWEEPPRLVHAVVSKAKSDVRGVDLALAVSQALPYIEYSLHKQLLFHLKLQKLNAVFGLRLTLCITSDTIIGAFIGTGVRLMALPVPSSPRVRVLDPAIKRNKTVMRLVDLVTQHIRLGRLQRHNSSTHGEENGSFSSTSSLANRMEDSRASLTGVGGESGCNSGNDQEPHGISEVGSAYDYVLNIDDEEEAEMMLDMTSDLPFEDSLLLTIPYVPEWVNIYSSQKRIVLNRRFAFQRVHNASFTTGKINECFADAKKAFVQLACRVAMRCHQCPLERLHVMGFSFDFFFEPNSCSLQLRLEGCLMLRTSSQRGRLMELEDSSFMECRRRVEWYTHHVPLVYNSFNGLTELPPPPVDTNTLHHASLCSAPTADGSNNTALGNFGHGEKVILKDLERSIFVVSNAPYALPFVFKRNVSPPVLWANEGANATPFAMPDVGSYSKDNRARAGKLGRQWQALNLLVFTTIRNFKQKTGVKADGKGGVDALHRGSVNALESVGSGGPILHEPVRRLPMEMSTLEANGSEVIFTPLDFVAGRAIARYVGRLSQHFIREAYEIQSTRDIGGFFQKTEFEIQCMVQAMVCLMGGNALLKHRVTYHEVWDSDGSDSASVFVTVTGDVVQTSFLPLASLSLDTGNSGEEGGAI
ncbi:putative C2 domain protein [Trypanosoma rangeli]|uniref:Putative C2 domain protein n=1 Tax=Trypanosoma rangeli TaxID=5698 RepID=A0A3R7ML75_TRYRA|nr:putative C2 domain protein [Trypanosoma rangeli]RNF04541.1 putative C2 domain protein [Trypanosoma rangeli]|eukprot:RNF04541.1 putative C2 domain protein [Trypanosoma rangeli]